MLSIILINLSSIFIKTKQDYQMHNLIKKKIALIGCGPVGMFGALLLQHFGLDYVCLEKFSSPRTHPSAHYISANSKSLLHQIPGITQKMNEMQEDLNNFRYYRYVEGICGHQLGKKNHFEPSIEDKLKKSKELFGQTLSHLPQNKFLQILYQNLKHKENIVFDQQITKITEGQNGKRIINSKGQQIANADYVIICNGVNSQVRNSLGFHLSGRDQIFNVINIHFKSKDLANQIISSKQQAMLHFSFGRDVVGILVNHSLEQGVFVIQIPNYLPIIDLRSFYSARDLILMTVDSKISHKIKDIEIMNIGNWKIQGTLANKMYKDNIFLAGDSAHAFPPAGGFGMNSGIQDMHEVVHSLKTILRNENSDSQIIFQRYCRNRRQVNDKYRVKALKNYQITTDIAKQLGYPVSIMEYFPQNSIFKSMISSLPQSTFKMLEQFRLKNMNFFYKRKQLQSPNLQLIFDQFDIEAQNLSKVRKQILQANRNNEGHDLWVKRDVPEEAIKQVCGEIESKNICFHDLEGGQKMIGSDGNILLK